VHTCIVCSFDGLEYPQYTDDGGPMFNICPCCGFQSGYHDLDLEISIEEYRNIWVTNGAKWTHQPQPTNWDVKEQLCRLNKEWMFDIGGN